jgi:hypothetical protein
LDDVCYNIHADTSPTTLLESRPNDPSWYKGYSKSDWVFTIMTLQAARAGDGLAVQDNQAFRARMDAPFPPTAWVLPDEVPGWEAGTAAGGRGENDEDDEDEEGENEEEDE